MNTKEQLRDQRNLMKTLKSNDYEGVKMMIRQKKVDLNFLDSRMYCSPLMFEVGRKKMPSVIMIQYLLDHGAKINFRDRFGMTALHLLMCGKTKLPYVLIIELLRNGADPNATNNRGETPLHSACMCTNTNAVKYLLECCNGQDRSNILKKATNTNIVPIDVNCINGNGDTPLMLATNNCTADNKIVIELVESLFELKAEINLVNKQNCSALHFAAKNGLSKVVHLLLCQGADVNIVDDEDLTSLEYACRSKKVKSLRSLLRFRADANRQNRYGRTPIHSLADVDYSYSFGEAERCLKLLVENRANINIPDHNGETRLSFAVRCCLGLSHDLVQEAMMGLIVLLIEEESDINIQLCTSIGNLVIGDTILHYAVKHMNWYIVALILRNSPDLHIRNSLQETARDVNNKLDAKDEKCVKIIKLFNKKMETIRIQSYSYLLQSWIMSDGEQEHLRQKGRVIAHAPNPATKKQKVIVDELKFDEI